MIKIKRITVEETAVYDITVDQAHSFLANGIVVHNCHEISLPTKGYDSVMQLYQDEYSGEVAMCALAGILPANIKSDAEYADAAYYALLMIDVAINETDYSLPQVAMTAKERMSAAVGIVGLAHHMAKHKMSYATQQGRDFLHELCETHYWHLLNASLKLAKEKGIAPAMHKTAWPQGYLPIDTYNKNTDSTVTVELKRDWESLRQQIIDNGGIRNSVLVAHAPTESSSLSSGTTNGVYPIRRPYLMKTSDTQAVSWVAPDNDTLAPFYDIAWELDSEDVIKCYGIIQKWTDQAISADLWVDVKGATATLSSDKLLRDFFLMNKLGVKTRYYINSRTSTEIDLNSESACEGCSL